MHQGHRERVKKKFLLNGFENFEDHEILEMLLFFAIPRRDTNELAHQLITEFGGLAAVFDAPIGVLRKVDGIGESASIFLKLIPQIAGVYLERKYSSKGNSKNLRDLCKKLNLKFIGKMEEVTAVILIDAKGKEVFSGIVHKGSVAACEIYVRKVIELISLYNASALILGHNHPSGFAMPSPEDLDTTSKLGKILKNMNVVFLDHIISADGDYVSLRESNIEGIFD